MIENVNGIEGLALVPDYISEAEEAEILRQIDGQPWSTELKRRVQHYGYRYDYKKRRAHASGYVGELPAWLLPFAERLYRDGFIGARPDQSVINEYWPGQGIAAHVDCIPCFGDTVLAISLGSPCVMDFTQARSTVKTPVLLKRRSLLIMKGVARYEWRHGIAHRKTDRYEGIEFTRGRRISVTFRKTIVENVSPVLYEHRAVDPPPRHPPERLPVAECPRLPGF